MEAINQIYKNLSCVGSFTYELSRVNFAKCILVLCPDDVVELCFGEELVYSALCGDLVNNINSVLEFSERVKNAWDLKINEINNMGIDEMFVLLQDHSYTRAIIVDDAAVIFTDKKLKDHKFDSRDCLRDNLIDACVSLIK